MFTKYFEGTIFLNIFFFFYYYYLKKWLDGV